MKRQLASTLLVTFMLSSLLAFFIFISDNTVSGETYGEGHITLDEVWESTESPIYIEGNVTVDYGVNLTIESGVEVRFNGFYNLYIEGNLTAIGNSSDPIIFTSNKSSPNTSDWESLQINQTGRAEIKYCDISYAYYGISVVDSPIDKHIYIQNNRIYNNWIGVHFYYALNNTISNNNASDNLNHGLFLSYSSENNIQDNHLSNNGKLSLGNGIHFHYSSYNTISNNEILSNNRRGIYLFWSEYNEMMYNQIFSNSYDGIYLTQSSNNVMRNNNISLNGFYGGCGVNLTSSTQNNRIFHNTFISNVRQADDATNNVNMWDDGYPVGGNYWGDYIGWDGKRGENQDVPGSDGIGDEPYVIDSTSQDNYPLMSKSRDIAPYLIALISPYNNSVIKAGTFIDLHILVQEYNSVNYSINGTGNFPLDEPWDINTSGWSEGGNRIDVFVNDTFGNVNSSWFYFVVDSNKPIIELISPLNNSIFRAGEIINISISEPNIKSAYYYMNAGSKQNLLFPYDINTSLWTDGNKSVEIHAEDVAGNFNSTIYVFTLDSSPPTISLSSPKGTSYIKPGTLINLSITDEYSDIGSVEYYSNGEGPNTLESPYDIITGTWTDDLYNIVVIAVDTLGNSNSVSYNITIDSIPPSVILNYPLNNSVIKPGILINFSAFDINPLTFKYSLNFDDNIVIVSPYDIETSDWNDMLYKINVNVSDYAGNCNLSWYLISIDSIPPYISLKSLSNNSYIKAGTEIAFDIYEPFLALANYSVNGGEYESLMPSLAIDTTGWPEGTYQIDIFAADVVGNNRSASFILNIDNSPPKVISTKPGNNDFDVSIFSSIEITFNEVMNLTSVIDALSITPSIDYEVSWSADSRTLIIAPSTNLTNDTKYTVIINSSAKDIAGNSLKKSFKLIFSTGESPKDWLWILLIAVVIIIIVLILLTFFLFRRDKGISDEDEAEEKEEAKETEEGEEIEVAEETKKSEKMDEVKGKGKKKGKADEKEEAEEVGEAEEPEEIKKSKEKDEVKGKGKEKGKVEEKEEAEEVGKPEEAEKIKKSKEKGRGKGKAEEKGKRMRKAKEKGKRKDKDKSIAKALEELENELEREKAESG